MDDRKDIRWVQRFANYRKALGKLGNAIERIKETCYTKGEFDAKKFEKNDDIIVEGLIQRFEYTHELAWNVMKDFLLSRGAESIYGSRDATREAFSGELIKEGELWMEMIKSRNKSSHTYNEETAMEIFLKILEDYYPCFLNFERKMSTLEAEEKQR